MKLNLPTLLLLGLVVVVAVLVLRQQPQQLQQNNNPTGGQQNETEPDLFGQIMGLLKTGAETASTISKALTQPKST